LLSVTAAAALRGWLRPHLSELPYFLFYPATTLAAIVAGPGPALAATLTAAAYIQFSLVFSNESFAAENATDIIRLLAFVSLGSITALTLELLRSNRRERSLAEQALHDSEERFHQLVDGVEDYAIFMLDRQGRVASWNTGAERIEGWSETEILGQDVSRVFPAEIRNSGLPMKQLAIAAGCGRFREEAERVRKDGSRFWADVAITALRDEQGGLRGYAEVIRDISERKRSTRVIVESRARLASVVESAMDAIITVDADQCIVLFNAAAVAMFGWPETEALGMPLKTLIPPHLRDVHAAHVLAFAKSGVSSRAAGKPESLTGLRRNGEEFPIEASISRAEVNGRTLLTVILRDVTARKRAEEHQSLLLRELAHRVKNTLAVVQSISAQTRRFAAPEEFHDTLTARLVALGTAHDLLTRSEWEGADLGEVVRAGFAPYQGLSAVQRWTIEGPRIRLAPNEAVTFSLVVHELATNAAKFGALSNATGTIEVRWQLDDGSKPTGVVITWRERGGPPVIPPTRSGFGSKLLDRAVKHELGGTTEVAFAGEGVQYRLRLPTSDKVQPQP
jgi:PAS domain S-box-containing protein